MVPPWEKVTVARVGGAAMQVSKMICSNSSRRSFSFCSCSFLLVSVLEVFLLPGVDVSRSNETVKFEPPRRWRVGAALVEVVPILTEDEEGGGGLATGLGGGSGGDEL